MDKFLTILLHALLFNWLLLPLFNAAFAAPLFSYSQGNFHGLGATRWLTDINGDGLSDYVAKNDDGVIHWNLAGLNADGKVAWSPPRSQGNVHRLGARRWLADINGDGLSDYVAKNDDDVIHWNLAGLNADGKVVWSPPRSQRNVHGLGAHSWLTDVNGDGLSDYVAKNDDGVIHWNLAGLNDDGSVIWSLPRSQGNFHGLGATRWLTDINGDGLSDYVAKNDDGVIHWNLAGLNADGKVVWSPPRSQGNVHRLGARRWLADINGDGLSDYVAKNDDDVIHWNLAGLNADGKVVWSPPRSQRNVHGLGAHSWLTDVNGDGLSDYVAKNDDGVIHWNLAGLNDDGSVIWSLPRSQGNFHGLGATRWLTDINGDGLSDYVAKNDDGVIHWSIFQISLENEGGV